MLVAQWHSLSLGMRLALTVALVLMGTRLFSQNIQVEYDKNRDFTKYRTFTMGEGGIITPKDQRVIKDETMHAWVIEAVTRELEDKGLEQVDSLSDLTVSYLIGSSERSDLHNLGPLGQTPGSSSQTWSRDYQQSSFIIDLNDRSNLLIWRINGVTSTSSPNAANMIKEVVAIGFKKFSVKPKKEKKKKR